LYPSSTIFIIAFVVNDASAAFDIVNSELEPSHTG
jgi:hypothetical protein